MLICGHKQIQLKSPKLSVHKILQVYLRKCILLVSLGCTTRGFNISTITEQFPKSSLA